MQPPRLSPRARPRACVPQWRVLESHPGPRFFPVACSVGTTPAGLRAALAAAARDGHAVRVYALTEGRWRRVRFPAD